MANTTNYNWETPDDTDLVKDGAAAIRTLGSSIDTTTKALNPETTLGDISYRSSTANTNTRLPIGTTGQILSVVGGVPAWVANDVGDITEVAAGTGISVASGTGPIPTVSIDTAVTADLTTAQTLTNKTLTAPIVSDAIIKGFEEDVNVVASAATGTINFDVSTASVWYYTSNATANHTLNFRYSSGVSLNTALATGDAITVVWLNTNGSTAYYPNVIQIDGNAVTPKVPAAISSGNASSIDAYSFTIIKTASATFTVLETQTKFA